ncbi:sulfotransferase family 2 domain-containing protein [Labrenzia sp. CE80]|uniref:sulfotransferase family 2 domain-containing protein n=1 Tax=Labrenzia sp. CE80 TaxID=1788986 RepID=UPI00129A7A66|nr:sulfotransferase family 2 domain-containing protein [Labrenzia sp. CE80]
MVNGSKVKNMIDAKKIFSKKPQLRTIPGITCRNLPLNYFSIPKSACTTVKNILYTLDSGASYTDPLAIHEDGDALLWSKSSDRELYIERLKKSEITFTFSRNPMSRVYSCFVEKIHFDGVYSFPRYRDFLVQNYGYRVDANNDISFYRENFNAFLLLVRDTLKVDRPFRWDPHWAPQSLLVDEFEKYVGIDFIGKVENFQIDMKTVLQKAGIDADVDLSVRYNESPPPPFKLNDFLDERLERTIRSIYIEDYDRFDY